MIPRNRSAFLLFLLLTAGAHGGDVTGQVVVRSTVKRDEKVPGDAYGSRVVPLPKDTDGGGTEVENVVLFVKENVPAPAGATSGEKVYMYQENTRFRPRSLAIRAGTTVYFKNLDPLFHNVFSLSSAKNFDLGKFPAPEEKGEVFSKPGVITVNCDIHAHMVGNILVFPHPYFAKPDRSGRFRIPDLPAGTYTIVAWHDSFKPQVKPVTVEAGGEAVADFEF